MTVHSFYRYKRQKALAPSLAEERVWDRCHRHYDELTNPLYRLSDKEITSQWHLCADALIQYIDNEWPIERNNKIRAGHIAEMAADLFFRGCFSPFTKDKALDLQSKFMKASDSRNFRQAHDTYCAIVGACSDNLARDLQEAPAVI